MKRRRVWAGCIAAADCAAGTAGGASISSAAGRWVAAVRKIQVLFGGQGGNKGDEERHRNYSRSPGTSQKMNAFALDYLSNIYFRL